MPKPALAALLVAARDSVVAAPVDRARSSDWPFYGGDQGGTKFSPLTRHQPRQRRAARASRGNGRRARRRSSAFGTRPGNFQTTPLMIDNVLYLSTPYNRVVALERRDRRRAVGLRSESVRGRPAAERHRASCIAASPRGATRRRQQAAHLHQQPLSADSASTRRRAPGRVVRRRAASIDLSRGPGLGDQQEALHEHVAADRLQGPRDPRQRRRRSARVPQRSARRHPRVRRAHRQAGVDASTPFRSRASSATTPGSSDSWSFTGHTNAWAPMTLDAERGLVYVPLGTPSNDFYGGRRPGANLFAESLVCLDANTGERKWHYQLVHHGLWDYDNPSPPNLVTIRVDGRTHRRRRAADEAGVRVRLRSRHRQAGLADRGAAGSGERRRRRAGLADAAVSDAGRPPSRSRA